MDRLFESMGAYDDLRESEKAYLRRWEDEALPLLMEFQNQLYEATLTKDQVLDMFKRIEKTADDSGKNRTALGKAIDIIKLPATLMDKIGELAAETAPVRKFDIAFARMQKKMRKALGDSTLLAVVDGIGKFALHHPIAQGFAIGLITLAVSAAMGPMALPIVGAILRFGNELLKGEKFSKAAGRAFKSGLLGLVAAWSIPQLTNMFVGTDVIMSKVKGYEEILRWKATYYLNDRAIFNIDTYIPVELQSKISKLYNIAKEAAEQGDLQKSTKAFDKIQQIVGNASWESAMRLALANNDELYEKAMQSAAIAKEIIKNLVVGARSVIAGIEISLSGKQKKTADSITESFRVEISTDGGKTSVIDIDAASEQDALRKAITAAQKDSDEVTARIVDNHNEQINEATWSELSAKVTGWAKGMTNKVTADKMMRAWQAAGSPTDSDDIIKVLTSQGIDHAVVDDYITGIGIEPDKSKSKPADNDKDQDKDIKFNTGDATLDEQLAKLLASNGKDAVVKALQSYKNKLENPAKKAQGIGA